MDEKNRDKGSPGRSQIKFTDFTESDTRPEIAVYAVDAAFKPLHTAEVDEKGNFDLPEDKLKKAKLVVVGPYAEDFASLDKRSLAKYRVSHFQEIARAGTGLEIAKSDWAEWLHLRYCVNGSVSHCYPYPWYLNELYLQSALESVTLSASRDLAGSSSVSSSSLFESSLLEQIVPRSIYPYIRYRCEVVCDGVVEVYRRTCCCRPWIIADPRLGDLLERLGRLVAETPIIRKPPLPDPPPFRELSFIKEGALDETVLSARRDMQAIKSLPRAEQAAYIIARPYLWCTCGAVHLIAKGLIRPDGKFHICWTEGLRLFLPWCHDEYAYKVKQVIGGNLVTIYNGVAANRWFSYGDFAKLFSYDPNAQGCRHNDFPGDGAFALLQDIGLTGSFNLKTPDADGAYSVANPVYNDGLCYPAANSAAAKGQWKDVNWGGGLLLRYAFSEDMKGIGARYYRISVCAANINGDPTGSRTYLFDSVAWKKYVIVGTDINVESVALGPVPPVGGQSNLFTIPYDADADWLSGQYHATLDTTTFANGRFLLTLEVFDAAGTQLRPTGTPDSGGTTQAGFTFRRWYQETGPTADVPFAALTHMLWWDNRPMAAQIVDLRVSGNPNTSECQFLEASPGTLFSAGYRAYHPNEMFQWYHNMYWRRGLGGPWGNLVLGNLPAGSNYNNVGQVGPPGESGTDTFANMLGSSAVGTKCSFSVNLNAYSKTFNGIGRLGLDAHDQAAFALEIV
jgi:hypothetical protein